MHVPDYVEWKGFILEGKGTACRAPTMELGRPISFTLVEQCRNRRGTLHVPDYWSLIRGRSKVKTYRLWIVAIMMVGLFLTGCADVTLPSAKEMLKDPLGEGSLQIGMTQDKVVSIYGEPDGKRIVISEEWSSSRDEWMYKGRYPTFPVNAGYFSEDLYLYFDGENLTNISKTPLGEGVSDDEDSIK